MFKFNIYIQGYIKGCDCTSLVFLSHSPLSRVVDLWVLKLPFRMKKVFNKMQTNYCLNNIHDDLYYSFFQLLDIMKYRYAVQFFKYSIFIFSLLWTRNRLSSYLGFNPFFSRKVSFLTLEVYVLMIVTHISQSSFKFAAHFLMHIGKLERINICLENVQFFHSWLEGLITFVTVEAICALQFHSIIYTAIRFPSGWLMVIP